jgi:hypothetical protein
MELLERALGFAFRLINKCLPWYRIWAPLQVLNLIALRINLRRFNLHDTETAPSQKPQASSDFDVQAYRSADGTFNDLDQPAMGCAGARFGRNIPLGYTFSDFSLPGEPSPRAISRLLMTRQTFIPATSLNVLAAAWIQFQVHDWFSHGPNDKSVLYRIPLDKDDDWPDLDFTVPRTQPDLTRTDSDAGRPDTFGCVVSHWWDGSQVYGSNAARQASLREGKDGRLKLTADGLLPLAPDNSEQTGVGDNWWLGLTVMHTLFAREHNAICAALKAAHPTLTDETAYQLARLANSALLAKIHTVEWTPALLNTPALQFGMRANWWGLLGQSFKKRYGRIGQGEILSGIVGSRTDHHLSRYAMTEEFVSVYRMHSLLPDTYTIRSAADEREPMTTDLSGVAGLEARKIVDKFGLSDCIYSLAVEHPGALALRNFPNGLQRFRHAKTDRYMDLAAIDILRDRERGLPRYSQFRQLLDMPAIRSVSELTDDLGLQADIRSLYGDDVEKIDLQVGLLGERPPEGFALSDTAFRIFILMASRRLKSDRFLTTHFTPEVYTMVGLDWIEETSMGDVVARHCPELESRFPDGGNVFFPWRPNHG